MGNDIKTSAIVLRRTNYGETDRILNLLTKDGRFSCIAKASRKEKSKLAGGIELFSISEVTIHFKNDASHDEKNLGILTSAKMIKFFDNIMKDLNHLEMGSRIIKRINSVSNNIDSPELYTLTVQCFVALNRGINLDLIDCFFKLNLARIMGEQMNLVTDSNGKKLSKESTYFWDTYEKVLVKRDDDNELKFPKKTNTINFSGDYIIKTEHIKLLRLILSSPLSTVSKVQGIDEYLPQILQVAKTFSN